jgi:hypothetical protein
MPIPDLHHGLLGVVILAQPPGVVILAQPESPYLSFGPEIYPWKYRVSLESSRRAGQAARSPQTTLEIFLLLRFAFERMITNDL